MSDIDPAFSALSHKPGLEVWRVSTGYSLTLLNKSEHGKFYTGDAYIILKVSVLKSGGVVFGIHYWLGRQASRTDAKVAASKAIDLDAALGSKSTSIHREVQGHESDLFLSYFRPCILPIPGAQGKPDPQTSSSEPQLWQVKGRRFVHVRQVPFARTSLSHSDVYILNNGGKKVYQFNGASCDKREKTKGLEVLQQVRALAGGPSVPFAIVEDNDMTAADAIEFWDLFGGFAPIAKKSALEDDMETKPNPPILSWVSANGAAEMARGPDVKRYLLEAGRCLIVDVGNKLFVWKGRTSSLEDRRAASVAAEIIVASTNRPPSTLVIFNSERAETAAFKELFSDWQGPKASTDSGASGKLRAAALSAMWMTSGTKHVSSAPAAKTYPAPAPLLPEGPYDMKVWRLNGNHKVLLGAEEVGVFYSGDCYLVQYSFVRDRKQECLLFFWAGKHCTPEERQVCTVAAERSAETRGGQVTLVRVVQGREPDQFFSLMKRNLFFLQGGLSKTYKAYAAQQGGDDTFDPSQQNQLALFLIKPRPNNIFVATQMPLTAKSLNSSECLVLLTPANPLLWIGGRSGEAELAAAQAAAEYLRPGLQVRRLTEGKETTVFWGHLGGRTDYPALPETRDGPRELRLFHVLSTASNPLKVKEVPGFKQEDLMGEDVMVLDTFQEVFVWLGHLVPDSERKEAFTAGCRYVDMVSSAESRSKDTMVVRVAEGYEPPMFTAFFDNWDHRKLGLFVEPYDRQLALLAGKSIEELEAKGVKAQQQAASDSGASQRAAAFAALQGTLAGETKPADTTAPATKPAPAPLSQKQAALASLHGAIETPPVATGPISPASSDSSTSSASSASQRAAALAALKGALPEEATKSSTEAPAMSSGPPLSAVASQRRAALAALQGTLQGEQEVKSEKPGPKGKTIQPVSIAEEPDKVNASPSTQRKAALAALQGALAGEGETIRKEATKSGHVPPPAKAQLRYEEPSEPANDEDALNGAITYPLARLRVGSSDPPPGIDTTKRETYLSDQDFQSALSMTRDQFYALPKWKQDQKKRSSGLY